MYYAGWIRLHLKQLSTRLYRIETRHLWFNKTQHTKANEIHNKILSLQSSNVFQTANFTEG